MAKALKVIGTVVAVVAIVAVAVATFGAATPAIAALAATVATAATVASAALSVVSALVLKPPGFSAAGNPQKFVTNPHSALPYNMGRTRMSGIRIHAETTDGFSDKTQNDVLGFGVLLSAGGPIDAIETFTADNASVASYSGFMSVANNLGTSTALSLSLGTASMPGWTSAHKLSGMAHALWMLRFDSKGEQFQAGVPEPAWIGRWAKVYDPRLDSTYPGGSGSHRALNESTYTWSRNPALHALTWCLGRWQNGKRILGIGSPVANIRVAEFVEAANVADANDWYCGGTVWSSDSKWGVLKSILQAGGAVPTMTGAMIGCLVSSPRVSITTVTKDHLLDSLKIAVTKSRRDKINAAIPRYRSEDHEWEVISGSPITNSTYETEDGGRKTREIDFPLVQHEAAFGDGQAQVGQLCAYEIVNSREAGPIEFSILPQFIGLKSGDCITLDVPEEGLVNQPVILKSVTLDPASAKITCVAETETAAKHAFALGQTTTPPPPFTLTPISPVPEIPDSALWDAVPGLTSDGFPKIVVTGASEYTIGVDVLIRYRKTGATDWFVPAVFADPRGTIVHQISPLDSLQSYDVEVAYRNGSAQGPWLALGPETTPDGSIGAAGPPGADGVSSYIHLAYATNSTGTTGFSTTDGVGKTYIGTYTDTTPADSTNPADYTWSLIKGDTGATGATGSAGAPGADGADGATLYTWYAYSDAPDGTFNFTTGAPGDRTFQGIAPNKTSSTESTNPADYAWSPYVGPPNFGLTAFDSKTIVSGNKLIKVGSASGAWDGSIHSTESYKSGASISVVIDNVGVPFMVGLNTDPTTNGSYDTIDFALYNTGAGGLQIYESGSFIATIATGLANGDVLTVTYNNKTVVYSRNGVPLSTNSSVASDLTLFFDSSIFTYGVQAGRILSFTGVGKAGVDGANGTPGAPGADGAATYIHVAYATAADGSTGFSTTDGTGKTYIGTYTDGTLADSTNPAVYTWTLIKGADGATGSPGATGATGAAGTSAITVTSTPPAWPIPCTFNGTPKSSVQGFQINVFQGTTNVSSSATYGTITSSGLSGVSVNSSGLVTVTGMTADTGYIEIPITYGGASGTARVEYVKIKDGNAAVSGEASITSLTNSGTYASSANFNISLANGQTFNASASASYFSASSSYTPQVKLAYVNVTDGGSETDMSGSEVTGGSATATEPETFSTSGSFTNSTGGTKTYNVRILTRRSAGGGNSASVSGSVGGTG